MLFNKNIILEILQSNFIDFDSEMESLAEDYAMSIANYELQSIFEYPVAFVLMEGIGEIQVKDYQVLEDEEESIVSGVIEAEVLLDGYVYWDGENECIDSAEGLMGVKFSFRAGNEKYDRLELERVY